MKFITGIIKDCINNKQPVKLRNGNKAYVFCDIRDYGLDIAHFLRVEASSEYPIVTVRDGKTSVTGDETERWASYQLLRAFR